MNILFFYGAGIDPVMGGISRITYLIATILRKRSHNVFFLAHEKLDKKYDKNQYFLPDKSLFSDKNKKYLSEIISDNNIQCIINQATLHPNLSKFIFSAKSQRIKIYSVIHHSMFSRFDNVAYLLENKFKKNRLSLILPILKNTFIIYLIKRIYKFKYSNHFNNIYNCSDKIIAVSANNIAEIQYMYGIKRNDKIIAINNGIELPSYIYNADLKKHTIVWVGSTDFYNKRVDVMLEIWSLIQDRLPDWDLKILGDGLELNNAKSLANTLLLKRIEFTGRVAPEEYLKQASLLCMTSASESFGLVLLEAMSFGVIPFAFNSFPAASDIINNGINGFLINPFDIQQYADSIVSLCIGSNNEKSKIVRNSIQQSKKFEINAIVTKWEEKLT